VRGRLTIVRHGQTEWSVSRQHTGRTDLPLTDEGRDLARRLHGRLADRPWALVLTSPLARARETADLAGLGERAEPCDDLLEWDYGEYEGRTTAAIREERPGWDLWTDGVPGGETLDQVASRVDRVVARAAALDGDTVAFAHAHVLRVLAARWLDLAPTVGRHLVLDTAAISTLGWERDTPALLGWNDTGHLR